jgi:hypothetical protein
MTVEELIEELEGIRARLQPRALSPEAYQAVGWADRPLRHLLDQCRQEQEAQSWADKHARDFLPILGQDIGTELSGQGLSGSSPRPATLPEPLPMRSMVADGWEASP